jgi:hypothetical protein
MIDNNKTHIENKTASMFGFISKTVFIGIFILFTALFVNFSVYAEDSIQNFKEKFAISLFSEYHLGLFRQYSINSGYFTNDSGFITNKPPAVGLGFRFKKFSASISFPVLFKDTSFDFEINPYFNKIYLNAYLKYYQDFYKGLKNEKSGLDILSSAMTLTYVANHENHSLGSVINLDKKQTVSNGSYLQSFGAFFSSIYSKDETMINYNERRQNLVYFGPGSGYSYTWVFPNDMFLNISTVIYINTGINTDTRQWLYVPQLEPRIIFGQHSKKWSFNIKTNNNDEFILKNQSEYDVFTLGSISLIFSRRF